MRIVWNFWLILKFSYCTCWIITFLILLFSPSIKSHSNFNLSFSSCFIKLCCKIFRSDSLSLVLLCLFKLRLFFFPPNIKSCSRFHFSSVFSCVKFCWSIFRRTKNFRIFRFQTLCRILALILVGSSLSFIAYVLVFIHLRSKISPKLWLKSSMRIVRDLFSCITFLLWEHSWSTCWVIPLQI